ncbi:hypothetical protein PGT21_021157 [Puccinia graminis f. sp. tritici]|uniref:Uncharacterized protein n=1 Tax=Puccinia graminis f. sp. tritici TaxID=56615 RepID=A0A5B0N2Z9_PUCGR|nr:hypothetical protein PGT21_021157 [Puccinia graminis f. sp. tritici]
MITAYNSSPATAVTLRIPLSSACGVPLDRSPTGPYIWPADMFESLSTSFAISKNRGTRALRLYTSLNESIIFFTFNKIITDGRKDAVQHLRRPQLEVTILFATSARAIDPSTPICEYRAS